MTNYGKSLLIDYLGREEKTLDKKTKNYLLFALLFHFTLILTTPTLPVKAIRVSPSHIGTFEGTTTFIATSETEVLPHLFIEVMDRKGNLTHYESEAGVITIPDTQEGTYVTQAKMTGATKYKDMNTGELLDTWKPDRKLELVSVKNPTLKLVQKNLINESVFESISNWDPLIFENNKLTFTSTIYKRASSFFPVYFVQGETYVVSWVNGEGDVGYHLGKGLNVTQKVTDDSNAIVEGLSYNKPFVWEKPSGRYYVRPYSEFHDATIKLNLQIEQGTTATAYEPYEENLITFNQPISLRQVKDQTDELDLLTGRLIQRTGEMTFDGSSDEAWLRKEGSTNGFYVEDTLAKPNSPLLANRLPNVEGWGDYQYGGVFKGGLGLAVIGPSGFPTIGDYYNWLQANPLTIQYHSKTPTTKALNFNYTYTFPPVAVQQMEVVGTIQPTIVSLIVPSDPLRFSLNPNEEKGNQFIAPNLTISNENYAPLTVELKEFEQISNVFNDVLPNYYESWEGLNREQSKNIALALIPKVSEGWATLNEDSYYVANHSSQLIGTIKGKSSVEFTFSAVHGISFAEPLNPQYQLVFVFNLLP